ncbi:MAG: hypothetical protein KBD53_06185 [Candidatus Omnitrophica bacterium]|nr:hypothetical protein [Candidatus Omnitrophota bacterium]
MRKIILILILAFFVEAFLGSPFKTLAEEETVKSSGDAILYLEALESRDEKVKYLLDHGKRFMEEQKYKEAREIAEYILDKLDDTSVEAKDLFTEAQSKEEPADMPQLNPVQIPLGE